MARCDQLVIPADDRVGVQPPGHAADRASTDRALQAASGPFVGEENRRAVMVVPHICGAFGLSQFIVDVSQFAGSSREPGNGSR